uniref:Uncharacterized protein n=1 Tax=Melanopsichium pennsylvanicum 4 TaxID=1398559 RepID=A0A077R2W9_9BASI|nr:uncharacterized protein BN887_06267 [Melanopsichium pennsylvanicum 4]
MNIMTLKLGWTQNGTPGTMADEEEAHQNDDKCIRHMRAGSRKAQSQASSKSICVVKGLLGKGVKACLASKLIERMLLE